MFPLRVSSQHSDLLGLEQSNQRQQTLVEGRQVFSRDFSLTQILVQQQTAERKQQGSVYMDTRWSCGYVCHSLVFVMKDEASLPSHSLVQTFAQRNRLQDGLQQAELVRLRLTCDRKHQVTQTRVSYDVNKSPFFC